MEHSGVDIHFVLFENLKRVRHSNKLHAHESFSMNNLVIKLIKTPVKVHTFLKKNVNLKSLKNFFGRSNPYNKQTILTIKLLLKRIRKEEMTSGSHVHINSANISPMHLSSIHTSTSCNLKDECLCECEDYILNRIQRQKLNVLLIT